MSEDRLSGTPFVIVPVWVMRDTSLSDRAVRLYGVLYGYVGEKKVAWPLQSTLAKDLNCGLASLKKALKELVDVGAVVRNPRYRENSNEIIGCWYTIVSDDPKGVANILANPSQHTGYPLASPLATELDTIELDTSKSNVATPAEPSTVPSSKAKKSYTPEVVELNNYLCQLIDNNGSRVPNGGEPDIEKLLRIDGRLAAEIMAVIDWCQSDPFWRSNILSAAKLRKQYDTLRLQMIAKGVHLPQSFSPEVLEMAKEWDFYDNFTGPIIGAPPVPRFPRPTDTNGNLLDSAGRAYYIDPMDYKRRYVDDE